MYSIQAEDTGQYGTLYETPSATPTYVDEPRLIVLPGGERRAALVSHLGHPRGKGGDC